MKLAKCKFLYFLILIVWGVYLPVASADDYGKVSLGFSFGTAFLKGDYGQLSEPGGMTWAIFRHRASARLSHELSAGYMSLVGQMDGVGSNKYRAKLWGLDISSVISALPDSRVNPYISLGLGVPHWSTDEEDNVGNVLRQSEGWGTNFFMGSGVEFAPSVSWRLRMGLKGRYYLTDEIDLDRKPWFRDELNDLSLEAAISLVYVFGQAPGVIAERPEAPPVREEVELPPPTEEVPPEEVAVTPEVAAPEAIAPEEEVSGFIFDRSSIPSGEMSHYVVQLTAWEDPGSAFWTADLMRQKGYPIYIESALIDGKIFYRVRTGPYGNVRKATEVSKSLKKYGYKCWIDREIGPWYVIKFVSVEEEENAYILAGLLAEDGYPVYVEPTGFGYYSVKAGPFPKREKAKEVGRKLKELTGRSYWIEKLEEKFSGGSWK